MAASEAAAPPGAPAPPPNVNSNSKANDESQKPRDYNQRWLGYSCIIFGSTISFASISNVLRSDDDDSAKQGLWVTGQICGVLTFSLSFLILLFDRFKCAEKFFDYTKALDGKVEGYALLFFLVTWIVGVAVLTVPDGLAYYTSNIFFSSWGTLAACAYTLNEWTSEKDIISFRELTQLSATLKTWYVLLLLSNIHFGSSVAMFSEVSDKLQNDAAFSLSIGLLSSLISLTWILIHYKFFEGIKPGGWLELATAFFLILMWTIGLTIFTNYEGISPSAVGSGCRADLELSQFENCTVITEKFSKELNETIIEYMDCSSLYQSDTPGSNLYLTGWGALFASVNLTLRWKAAQALQFAQAAQNLARASSSEQNGADAADEEDDDDAI